MCDFCCDFENVEDLISHRIKIGDLNDNFIETSLTIHADEKNSELIFSQMLCGNDLAISKFKINYCPMCGRLLTEKGSMKNLSVVKKFDYKEQLDISIGEVMKSANNHCDNSSSCENCDLEECCPMNICSDLLLQKLRFGEKQESE